MNVVILAGGRCPEDLHRHAGVEWRALLPFGHRTALDVVREALRAWGEPIVVGPSILGPGTVPGGASFVESFRAGLERVQAPRFLLCTSDLPFLREEAVRDFVTRASDAAIAYPIVEVGLTERAFPGMKRTSARLREGRFTGGNVALFETDAARRILPLLEEAYALRKRPLALARRLGWGTLARVLVGQAVPAVLPLASLERAARRLLGVDVRAVRTPYPELGADVDDLGQYLQAYAVLSGSGGASSSTSSAGL